jgi:hypothetical protein
LVQLSFLLAQRPPHNAQHTPPFQALQQFITHCRGVTQNKGQSTALYDDPDSQYFSQSEVIREYNERLKTNPEYILPEGFKKIALPDLQFQFRVSAKLGIPEAHAVGYEIMSAILAEALGYFGYQLIFF